MMIKSSISTLRKLLMVSLFSFAISSCGFNLVTRYTTSPSPSPAPGALIASTMEVTEKKDQTQARLLLPNGLEVLMISSPQFQKASAAMAVPVGAWSDPEEHLGLAHYLEHMLFQGTKEFPNPGDYRNYLVNNGGNANAYTARDLTNYMFEVNTEALDGALHRFSRFFISPTLNPASADKERNAVHSEYERNLRVDGRRLYSGLIGQLAPEGHPIRKFSTGSLTTLANANDRVLRAFYEKHYSADTMKLVIMSPQPIETQRSLIEKYFKEMPNRKLAGQSSLPSIPENWKGGQRLDMKTLKDTNSLTLLFPVPSFSQFVDKKPDVILKNILGTNGKNSLLSALKARHFATDLNVDAVDLIDVGSKTGLLSIQIDLTEIGAQNIDEITQYAFSSLGKIKRTGLQEFTFNETQSIAKLNYEYKDLKSDARTAALYARYLLNQPALQIDEKAALITEKDQQLIQQYLDALTPDKVSVIYQNQNVRTDKVERFYGTEYSLGAISEEQKRKFWIGYISEETSMAYPEPNPFIPADLALLKNEVHPSPVLISDDGAKAKLWFLQETGESAKPYGFIQLRILSHVPGISPTKALLNRFYAKAINYKLQEQISTLKQSGYDVKIDADTIGIQLSLRGYSDHFPKILQSLFFSKESQINLSYGDFDAIKELLDRELKSYDETGAFERLLDDAKYFRASAGFRNDELKPELEALTLNDLQTYIREFYEKIHVQGLVYGNLKSADFKNIPNEIFQSVRAEPITPAQLSALIGEEYLLQPEQQFAMNVLGANNNNAFVSVVDAGLNTPANNALAMLTGNLVTGPYFNELRSVQQLGYAVQARTLNTQNASRLQFLIQSARYNSDELRLRSDEFLKKFISNVSSLVDGAFRTSVNGLTTTLNSRSKDMDGRFKELTSLLTEKNANWNYFDDIVDAVQKVTPDQLKTFMTRVLTPEAQGRLTLRYIAQGQSAPPTLEGEVLINSRSELLERLNQGREPEQQALPVQQSN